MPWEIHVLSASNLMEQHTMWDNFDAMMSM